MVQSDHGGAQGQGLGDAKTSFLMDRRVDQGPCAPQEREQLRTRNPTLESNPVSETPPLDGPLQTNSLGTVPAETENCFLMPDVSEGPKRQHRGLPREKPSGEEEIGRAIS
jgi:hypothetical protein